MGKRRYDQYCALSRALDVIGERWTLLIVRELLLGPMRYTDLAGALPGIGTNLLADRLKDLERNGVVVRRRLPAPAASTVYELSDHGRELEPVVVSLTRWGGRWLGYPAQGEHFRPAWLGIALQASFRADAAAGVHAIYELRLDDVILEARVEDGSVRVGQGPAEAPDVVITTDAQTFLRLLLGQLAPEQALSQDRVALDGDVAQLRRLLELFGFVSPARAAAPAS